LRFREGSVAALEKAGKLAFMQVVSSRFSLLILAVLTAAWVVAANHCALASIAGARSADIHSCCHKTSGQTKPCEESCCARLTAPVPVADGLHPPTLGWIAVLPEVSFPEAEASRVVETGSGPAPPVGVTLFFVEFIAGAIHQSIAPPVVVVA